LNRHSAEESYGNPANVSLRRSVAPSDACASFRAGRTLLRYSFGVAAQDGKVELTMTKNFFRVAAVLSVVTLTAALLHPSPAMATDALMGEFQNPPAAARPRVWWHWMDGNVTKDGIKSDLEWMKRIGIGGVQTFDASLGTPQKVTHRLPFMSKDWQDAFRFAAGTARRLRMEMSIAGSPGWSESGGPWVREDQAMKKLVWSDVVVEGGKPFAGKLAAPPSVPGPFQNVPIHRSGFAGAAAATVAIRNLYKDVAVLAYKLPDAEFSMSPSASNHNGAMPGSALWDGDLENAISIPLAPAAATAYVQYDFSAPRTVRALTLVMPSAREEGFFADRNRIVAVLESSTDGTAFNKIADVKATTGVRQTVSFAAVNARYFRLVLSSPKQAASSAGDPLARTAHRLAEFVLHGASMIDSVEDKAAFVVARSLHGSATDNSGADTVLHSENVIDLSAAMDNEGMLRWQAPAGRWKIVRFGYSLLGIINHPASAEGTGLEVDKLSKQHVQSYVTQYLDMYAGFLSKELMGSRGLHGMVNDSWEAGAQNWTDSLPAEFARRRGYSLTPWLPALLGHVIDSTEETERFLWDYRQTLAAMLAENHYGVIASELHRRGMIHYAESHEVGRAFIGDGMDTKRYSDVPMSSMWSSGIPQDQFDADIRESASVAHLYGQNLVAAESMTAAGNTFGFVPANLKATADRMLANGLNRFVIHTSVHQPLNDVGPGFTLGPFGLWFTRHETWAEQAKSWISYLSRSAYLLQQGTYVADVLYYYGEDSNITALYGASLPDVPEGFGYDFANPAALALLTVKNGMLTSRSGMRYRVLALDPRATTMSLSVLTRIGALVAAGAIVVGNKPSSTPSLADNVNRFHALADAIWGADGKIIHRYGKGQVIPGQPLDAVLAGLDIAPDFSYSKAAADSKVLHVHRKLKDGDLYFLSNRQQRAESTVASFRVTGKVPELWHADTGTSEPVSYRMEHGRTIVPLALGAGDAVFVVFRRAASGTASSVADTVRSESLPVTGPWEVTFSAPGATSAAKVTLAQLSSWNESTDASMRYFSGTASYRRDITVAAARKGERVELNLGDVKSLAEVLVNGQSFGVLWKAPYRVDISKAIKPGTNALEVRVTNTWVNRLIGDQQAGASSKTFTTFNPYHAESPLQASGLLGPVTLQTVSRR
jgi:hypothetical protein